VGPDVEIPVDAKRVIDLSDATVLPGLYDVHTHLCTDLDLDGTDIDRAFDNALLYTLKRPAAYRSIQGVANARSMLEAGFTTVRDLGNAGNYADVALKNAVSDGLVVGPTIDVAGKIISPFGGQFTAGAERPELGDTDYVYADTLDELRKAIRRNIYLGANWIKVVVDEQRYSYSLEELEFIVAEAHAARVKVAAHCSRDEDVRRAIEAGVDSIEHATRAREETLAFARERGVVLVGTDHSAELLRLSGLPEEYVSWRSTQLVERLRRALAARVPIAFGSDVVMEVEGHDRGSAALLVLESWIEAGMTPAQILQGLITVPARLLDDEDKRGAVRVGFEADLIATRGDPLSDPRALYDVLFVMKRGRVIVE
jgi:imidazolonepropionase-like amidohydrolase